MNVYDKHGIPILPGDTLKMFHYVSAIRREKCYMYKYVLRVDTENRRLLRVSHLSQAGPEESYFFIAMDGKVLAGVEIVQGYGGVAFGDCFRDRKRSAKQKEKSV